VGWPDNAFQHFSSPFTIGILGNHVGPYLEQCIKNEKINGHPIRVRYLTDARFVEGCHIIFIEKTHASFALSIISDLKDKPVLTVSDANNFMKVSGMIRFYIENNRIRLEINPQKSEESKLVVSAKLLSLAAIYKSK
jgi:hypothetical protein